MKTGFAYQFFNKFKNDRFSLAYMGEFDDELTDTLMRTNSTSIQEPIKFKKRLSFLIAESFQNIIRHDEKLDLLTETEQKPKVFLLRNLGNSHYISSTNLISNSKKENLKEKLNTINTLSAEDLKSIYIDALTNNEISEKGGGGLGLIEMARKSESPLEFDFDSVNFDYSVFYIQVRIITSEKTEASKPQDLIDYIGIGETKDLYNLMLEENILLIRKGDFSQESILPLIDLMEGNLKLQSNFSGSKKITMFLLIELLQNISKHGLKINDEREGIFLISQNDNSLTLSTGNYIDSNLVEQLKNQLERITSLDKDQLFELYQNTVLKQDSSGNTKIGLIELCKRSKKKVAFAFDKIDDKTSFFSISVAI